MPQPKQLYHFKRYYSGTHIHVQVEFTLKNPIHFVKWHSMSYWQLKLLCFNMAAVTQTKNVVSNKFQCTFLLEFTVRTGKIQFKCTESRLTPWQQPMSVRFCTGFETYFIVAGKKREQTVKSQSWKRWWWEILIDQKILQFPFKINLVQWNIEVFCALIKATKVKYQYSNLFNTLDFKVFCINYAVVTKKKKKK